MTLFPAKVEPEALALDDLTRTRSWRELETRSLQVAHLLRDECGLPPGAHAAILMENRVECFEITLGAIFAGMWLTPINHHLTAEEVAYILADSGAGVLFTDESREPSVRANAPPHLIVAGEDLEHRLSSASAEPISPDSSPGAWMLYTSGTTGKPKGVMRPRPATLRESFASMRKMGATLGLDGSGPHLVTGPLYHAAPLAYAVWDLLSGASLVLPPRWDALQTLELISSRQIQHTHMVPTMFVRLLQLDEATRKRFDLSSLSLVLHGAAPTAPAIKRKMIEWWGEILVEYWGASEPGTLSLASTAEWLAHPGTVGKPLANFEIFACDDQGTRLPEGEIGILFCRHRELAQVFTYHNDPEKTAQAHPKPHLFTIGDIGYVNQDGYIYLCDRQSNLIISGGVNIYPAEIESVLAEHPAVADVAVFGVPDEEWGETVKAAIELAPGFVASSVLEAEILDFAKCHLARFKLPRAIDFEPKLPRNAAGKLLLHRLRTPRA